MLLHTGYNLRLHMPVRIGCSWNLINSTKLARVLLSHFVSSNKTAPGGPQCIHKGPSFNKLWRSSWFDGSVQTPAWDHGSLRCAAGCHSGLPIVGNWRISEECDKRSVPLVAGWCGLLHALAARQVVRWLPATKSNGQSYHCVGWASLAVYFVITDA